MDNRLYIANSQIVFSFRRNLEIRKRIFEFEDALKDEFKIPFRAFAIPDDIDPNIPRFESQSLHSHSRIQVSQTRIIFATKYNDQFKLNYKQVENYIENKFNLISKLTESEKMNFVAYIVELGIHMNEKELNPFIKKNTGVFAINDTCRDFSLLYSKEYKSDFYLNIKCSKFVEQEMKLHEESKSFRPTGNIKHGISVVLDINSKPFFDKNKKFDTSLNGKIKEEVFQIINLKRIEDYLKGEI